MRLPRHRPRDLERRSTRPAEAAAEPRHAGHATRPARRSRLRSALAGLEEGIDHARLPRALRRRRRPSTAATSSAAQKGGHGIVDLRARDRAVVQRVLLHASATCSASTGSTSGRRARPRRDVGIDLPNEIAGLVPSTAWKSSATKEKWYAGETISVSIGQGQVSVTPISLAVYDGDGGQRRHAHHAARAQGDGRRQGLEAGADAAAAVAGRRDARQPAGVRDGLWMVVNGAGHRRPRAASRARRLRQDRHGAGHLDDQGQARAAARRTCATTAGSCSSRRATIRRSPASSSPSTASTATTPRRSPST